MATGSIVRFRRQLLIGYTALLFVLIVTGATAVLALRVTNSRLEAVGRDLASDMLAIERLRYQSELIVSASRGYLLAGDERYLSRFTETIANIRETLAMLDRHRAELVDGLHDIESAVDSYIMVARQAVAERRGDSSQLLAYFESTVVPARKQLEQRIEDFAHREQDVFEHESHHAHELADRMQAILIAATTIGVLLSAMLARMWFRRLSGQYAREREATDVAKRAVIARDELLAVVSHDLRNPLSAITLRATMMKETVPEAHRHAVAIGDAAMRMEHLIEELLDVAKLESGRFELHRDRCEASSLLDATVAMFEATAAANHVELKIESTATAPISVDRERILQVLSNLVGNALKFIPPAGGRITLRAEPAASGVRFSVADSGPGIARDQVSHLFERYWQGRPRGKGSLGLGLYICKQIVEGHGGRIGVDTTVGAGSTFWFTLPA